MNRPAADRLTGPSPNGSATFGGHPRMDPRPHHDSTE